MSFFTKGFAGSKNNKAGGSKTTTKGKFASSTTYFLCQEQQMYIFDSPSVPSRTEHSAVVVALKHY